MPSKLTPDRFLNFAEVAEMIGLAVKTIRNGECGTHEIPRIKLGGRVVFSLLAVQRWMERKAREAEERKSQSQMTVIDLVAEQRRRQQRIEDVYTTFVRGGRYQR